MTDPKHAALQTVDQMLQHAQVLLSASFPTGEQRARLALISQLCKNLRETIDWSWPAPEQRPERPDSY